MKKLIMFLLILSVILGAIFVIYIQSQKTTKPKEASLSQDDTAINQAKYLFEQAKLQGWDFSNGPCLSNDLIPGWVADIAHQPREVVDDLPENQCSAYREGRAKHFVELDIDGNVIRVK